MTIRLSGNEKVEVDGLIFEIRPQQYQDFAVAVDFTDKMGMENRPVETAPEGETPEDDENPKKVPVTPKTVLTGWYCLIERIVGWEGIEGMDGKPAPCTQDNKLALFGQEPNLLKKIADGLGEQEEEQGKNSDASPAG
jgi:hypothetical protein